MDPALAGARAARARSGRERRQAAATLRRRVRGRAEHASRTGSRPISRSCPSCDARALRARGGTGAACRPRNGARSSRASACSRDGRGHEHACRSSRASIPAPRSVAASAARNTTAPACARRRVRSPVSRTRRERPGASARGTPGHAARGALALALLLHRAARVRRSRRPTCAASKTCGTFRFWTATRLRAGFTTLPALPARGPVSRLFVERSSGSTGQPVTVLKEDYDSVHMWAVLRFWTSPAGPAPAGAPEDRAPVHAAARGRVPDPAAGRPWHARAHLPGRGPSPARASLPFDPTSSSPIPRDSTGSPASGSRGGRACCSRPRCTCRSSCGSASPRGSRCPSSTTTRARRPGRSPGSA